MMAVGPAADLGQQPPVTPSQIKVWKKNTDVNSGDTKTFDHLQAKS
jgi:hypothetical protein